MYIKFIQWFDSSGRTRSMFKFVHLIVWSDILYSKMNFQPFGGYFIEYILVISYEIII